MADMPSPATECDPCAILGHPCRSHDATFRNPDAVATRPTACGIDDCCNPTLHSHSDRQKAERARQREDIETLRVTFPRAVQEGLLPLAPDPCPLPFCTISGEPHVHLHIDPDPTASDPFPPGQWVKVWAQVARDQRHTHPEDLRLVMWTHNSDEQMRVKRTHVEPTSAIPAEAPRCNHLSTHPEDPTAIVRCESYEGPGHKHYWESHRWSDKESTGFFEER